MKEKFMEKVSKIWDWAKDAWEDTKVYALLSGIALTIGGLGFAIGYFAKKK